MSESNGISLEELAQKYGGKEVKVIVGSDTIRGVEYPNYRLDMTDETINSLSAEFKDIGFELRIKEPGSLNTMGYERDRYNVEIVEGDDKKWRLASEFTIG